jgi:UDP-glucose 4-epimerase
MPEETTFVFGGGGFLGKAFLENFPGAVACDSHERLKKAGLLGICFDFGSDQPNGLPCKEGDTAVVFSWRGYPAAHDADPVGKLSLNLNSTLQLIRFLAERRVGKILYASTGGAVYGDGGKDPISEKKVPQPIGFYGIGKATAEMYVSKICREYGVKHAIFRIGNAYGIGQVRENLSVGLIARAILAAKTGIQLEIWGDGSNRRDYIHANDVASAFVAAMESSNMESGIYNVGSGTAYSNRQIISIVGEVLGLPINVEWRNARSFDVGGICLDCEALKAATGWLPRVDLKEGILEMAAALDL